MIVFVCYSLTCSGQCGSNWLRVPEGGALHDGGDQEVTPASPSSAAAVATSLTTATLSLQSPRQLPVSHHLLLPCASGPRGVNISRERSSSSPNVSNHITLNQGDVVGFKVSKLPWRWSFFSSKGGVIFFSIYWPGAHRSVYRCTVGVFGTEKPCRTLSGVVWPPASTTTGKCCNSSYTTSRRWQYCWYRPATDSDIFEESTKAGPSSFLSISSFYWLKQNSTAV